MTVMSKGQTHGGQYTLRLVYSLTGEDSLTGEHSTQFQMYMCVSGYLVTYWALRDT